MDIVAMVASKSGLSPELVKKGLGVLLVGMQKFAPDLYSKVSGFIPNSGEMISAFNSAQDGKASGGLLGTVAGLAGKMFGGNTGDAAELMQMFGKAGFSVDEARQFAPAAVEELKAVVPPEIMDEVCDRVPGLKQVS